MDPEAALRAADQAISDCDVDTAAEMLDNYIGWRMRHGYEPQNVANSGMAGDKFASYCARRLDDLRRHTVA